METWKALPQQSCVEALAFTALAEKFPCERLLKRKRVFCFPAKSARIKRAVAPLIVINDANQILPNTSSAQRARIVTEGRRALETLQRHWTVYLMEAWGLGMFMAGAGVLTTLLEYPGSPIHQAVPAMGWRLVILGVGMGLVVAGIVYSPWGKRSGAHINPSVTWAFYRLGKIHFWDAVFYTAAQFAGAIFTIQILTLLIGTPFRDAAVNYALPKIGPPGVTIAFGAEFAISLLLMIVLLFMVNRKALENWVGAVIAILIALYLFFETPLSGMSLNPARTFGSALAAQEWKTLWVYFFAPTLAMLLAAEIYLHWQRGQLDGPSYPVEKVKIPSATTSLE